MGGRSVLTQVEIAGIGQPGTCLAQRAYGGIAGDVGQQRGTTLAEWPKRVVCSPVSIELQRVLLESCGTQTSINCIEIKVLQDNPGSLGTS